jgi:hypothetical protein
MQVTEEIQYLVPLRLPEAVAEVLITLPQIVAALLVVPAAAAHALAQEGRGIRLRLLHLKEIMAVPVQKDHRILLVAVVVAQEQ